MRTRTRITALLPLAMLVLVAPWTTPGAGGVSGHRVIVDVARDRVTCEITHSETALEFGRSDGFDTVRMEGCRSRGLPGEPALPSYTLRVALPEGMRASGARVHSLETLPLPGNYTLATNEPPRPIDGTRRRPAPVRPDPTIYASSDAWPRRQAELLGQADLAGQSIAYVRVAPLTYSPATGKLSLATSLTVVIDGKLGYMCGDYLPESASERCVTGYRRALAAMVVNPKDVRLVSRPGAAPAVRGVAPGQYGYVIITNAAWVGDFQPLADWRTACGTPSTIVTTSWIYTSGGYVGSNLEKIRAFIADAHATWGATDFLLGGDTNNIPYAIRTVTVPGYSTDDIPNDTYYADYDDDFVCEVNVGRASVRTTTDISTFTGKLFTYEKTPPDGYVTTIAFFGFDITDPGDQNGEMSKEGIRSLHIPPSWTVDTEYDNEPGSHKADVLAYLESGYHLVNHHDHCNADCMGTGWISHGDLMYTSDIWALTNRDRLCTCFAVGCNPADFVAYISVGEGFVLNPSGGGFAFIGNTRTGWGGSSEDPHWYSALQDRYFYRNLFDDGFVRMGANFSDLKNDEYDPYDPYNLHEYCFTQLHLLGDPMVPVWSAEPDSLVVTHPDRAFLGVENSFPVDVVSGGGPVDGATVCLWKDGDVYEVAETVGGGATITFTPADPGTLRVTVTARNCLPYEGEADVTDDTTAVPEADDVASSVLALTSVAPNPFARSTEIAFSLPSSALSVDLAVFDCAGRRVRTLVSGPVARSVRSVVWDGRDGGGRSVASGVYFARLRCHGEIRIAKVVVLR